MNTPDHSHEQPELSIVIALLNEAESLPELYQQVLTALEPTGKSFEILFIDDGSRDGSFEIIR
ncbi:MAG: glycosyltransferase, partial [Candidatus Latescibacteria bacterium]|nr:glycosyltransferase [Candidatus Latescibacterota bacterium]